jgi:hypothetical protein
MGWIDGVDRGWMCYVGGVDGATGTYLTDANHRTDPYCYF